MRNHIETKRYAILRKRLALFPVLPFLFSFFTFALSGCGDIGANRNTAPAAPAVSDKTLYVTNGNDGKLLAFNVRVLGETLTVKGENIPPARQFPGIVSRPAGLFLDRANDTLYVANPGQNAIHIYDNASTLTAPSAATRSISGDLTRLDQPFDVTFDATSGKLFVVNKNGNTLSAFCIGTNGGGNIAPCNLLVGDLTQLDSPRALAVDSTRKILYISNMGNNSILVYADSDNIGAAASECASTSSCNIKPTAVIAPHTGTENVSKLELPFGIFIDSTNDRLYVANTGLNTPAVFIYENASNLDGAPIPERVLSGLKTQLTVPAGIDVDEATGRLSVLNNNSPNNVNISGEANTDSPSLLIFNDILTTCPDNTPDAADLCDLEPSRRAGGDVSPQNGGIVINPQRDTLTNPLGVAFDPLRDVTYVANTGGNSIMVYSVEGDVAPMKENAGDQTLLDVPSSFFYDAALDRLYVTNAGTGASGTPFMVYDQVSNMSFGNAAPSWKLAGSSNFETPMGIYIDKTRNLMLLLNSATGVRLGIYVYDLTTGFRVIATPSPPTPIDFPINDAIGPTGETLLPPTHISKSIDGLSDNGPTALTVDESRGLVYVADKNNSIVIYDYYDESLNAPAMTRLRTITGLNKPSGLFVDAQNDILYVSNNGEEPGATAGHTANTVFVFEQASTKGDGEGTCPTPCPPDRIISTAGLTAGAQNKLKAPISPYVDMVSDRLYLINSASDQNAIFSFNNASTAGDSTAACINGSGTCTDTLPTKVIIGAQTKLDFSKTGALFIGAAVLSRNLNNETLYIATSCSNPPTCTQGGLFVFGSEGQLEPSRIWAGGGSFTTPEAVALDSSKDMLYIANQSTNTLSRLANASQLSVVSDASTAKINLTNIQLNRPAGLFADAASDRLYVSNSEAFGCSSGPCNAILVFDNASTLAAGAEPKQILTDTALNQPQGLALHPTSQRLYVANTGGGSILVYNQVDTLNGAVSADVILTGFSAPSHVTLDPVRDILYVLDQSAKNILVFDNASALSGGESAARTISSDDGLGNNTLTTPSAIFIDAENNLLYLADSGENSVSIFTNASIAFGPISPAGGLSNAPKKTFWGDQTGLQSPSSLTVGTPPLS